MHMIPKFYLSTNDLICVPASELFAVKTMLQHFYLSFKVHKQSADVGLPPCFC